MFKGDDLIGTITLYRLQVKPFTDKQVALVESFADQALIAIENARLFEEVQARTRELQEALEYQTATSEVLGVISQSPAKIQPVLDTIAETAQRLCQSADAYIFKLDEGRYRLVAANDARPERVEYLKNNPIVPDRGSVVGRVALEGRSIQVADVLADCEYTLSAVGSEGYRTTLGVPLLRDAISIGVIILTRYQVQPFSEKQVELVTTFADQAVIAIENTRLFEEVQSRNRDLSALGEVGRAVSSTLDLKVVLKTIVDRAVELSGTDAGSIFYYRQDGGRFELGETTGLDEMSSRGSASSTSQYVRPAWAKRSPSASRCRSPT
jgi:GAF domain-containing protein